MNYFQAIDHDLPVFIIGYFPYGKKREKYMNLKERGEFVTNIVSWNMAETIDTTSVSESFRVFGSNVSNLYNTETMTIGQELMRERLLLGGDKMIDMKKLSYHRGDGMSIVDVVMVNATEFWVREAATNEQGRGQHIDLDFMRPVVSLKDISY